MNIFVSQLNPATTPGDLQKLFAHYGLVTNAKVIKDHFTGKSKRYGFVEMPNKFEASEALLELDSTPFMENIIIVKNSKPAKYRISSTETKNRSISVPEAKIGLRQDYTRNSTIIIKHQQDNRRSGERDYRGFDYYGFCPLFS
jgi:RNA recognition motif-containing protein